MLPVANPSVIFQRVEDGAVLFAPATEIYFGLNEVGVVIWEALPPISADLDELCERIRERYPDAEATTIRADVLELLEQLIADGLAIRDASGDRDASPSS